MHSIKPNFEVEGLRLDESNEFGLEYKFTLADAIDECPEYVTRPDVLIRLAKEVQLELLEILPFENWLTSYKGKSLNADEMAVSFLYASFVFIKN